MSPEHVAAAREQVHDHLKNTHYAAPVKRNKGVKVRDAAAVKPEAVDVPVLADAPDAIAARVVKIDGLAAAPDRTRTFEIIDEFANKIGAAVDASRAAVDAGYVPNEMQIGRTVKILAPELRVATCISGVIQDLTGIRGASATVAINTDGEAPIFETVDFGFVGDLFKLIPELKQAL